MEAMTRVAAQPTTTTPLLYPTLLLLLLLLLLSLIIPAPLQITLSNYSPELQSPLTTTKMGHKISAMQRSRALELGIPSTTSDRDCKLSGALRFAVLTNLEANGLRLVYHLAGNQTVWPTLEPLTPSTTTEADLRLSTVSSLTDVRGTPVVCVFICVSAFNFTFFLFFCWCQYLLFRLMGLYLHIHLFRL